VAAGHRIGIAVVPHVGRRPYRGVEVETRSSRRLYLAIQAQLGTPPFGNLRRNQPEECFVVFGSFLRRLVCTHARLLVPCPRGCLGFGGPPRHPAPLGYGTPGAFGPGHQATIVSPIALTFLFFLQTTIWWTKGRFLPGAELSLVAPCCCGILSGGSTPRCGGGPSTTLPHVTHPRRGHIECGAPTAPTHSPGERRPPRFSPDSGRRDTNGYDFDRQKSKCLGWSLTTVLRSRHRSDPPSEIRLVSRPFGPSGGSRPGN